MENMFLEEAEYLDMVKEQLELLWINTTNRQPGMKRIITKRGDI